MFVKVLYNTIVPTRTAVVLFTRDLRVHDHPALAEAAAGHDAVVPLFVLDERILRSSDSPNRAAFLLDALADLRRSLRRLGGDLIVRRGDPVDETIRIARTTGAHAVFVGADVSAYAAGERRGYGAPARRASASSRAS